MESNYSGKVEAGIDEVGRGALAGPVVAAAVILPKDFKSENIKDSKKLTEKRRKLAFEEIKENALDWSVSFVTAESIDNINIQNATFAAMHESLNKLKVRPEHLLVDGNVFDGYENVPHTCITKGDDKYLSIAAASIVAKVTRDEYMKKIGDRFPQYEWGSNKGYGSKRHRETIQEQGITQFHRKTFLKNILQS
jgi:ribonuclease HII